MFNYISIDRTSKFYNIIKKIISKCLLLDQVAFCEDGYADVVESKDKKFYIGVRFHPESLYKIDENMNNIFVSFISSCKN